MTLKGSVIEGSDLWSFRDPQQCVLWPATVHFRSDYTESRRAKPSLFPEVTLWEQFRKMAVAEDLLGLYIGAAVGESDVRLDRSLTSTLNDVSEHHSGWKAIVGIRPLPIVGAELEYLDFGNPSYASDVSPTITGGVVNAKAEALFGMVYAPIPISFLDVYGKLGLTRLQMDANGAISGLPCPSNPVHCGVIAVSRTNTDLGYGAGVQFKFGAAAVRAEYERINSSIGDPDMVSLSITWTF